VALFVLAVCLYAGTFGHEYALDDALVITRNELTRAGWSGIPDLLSHDSFYGYFGKSTAYVSGGRYRPLSLVTFAVEQALFGPDPRIGHVVNVFLYGLTAILLFRLLWRLLPRPGGEAAWLRTLASPAFLATALFVAHPIHSEVVANIKGRDEILAFGFSLLALRCALGSLDAPHWRLEVLAGLCFGLGLLAKESAITFLAVVPLTLRFFRGAGARELWRAPRPLLLAAAVFLLVREALITMPTIQVREELLNDPFLGASLGERYGTILYTLGLYGKLLVFPHPLTYDYYPYHVPLVGLLDVRALGPLLVYVVLGLLSLRGFGARRVPAYAFLYFVITLSVASNLVFPVGTFMAERFLYAPSLGFCLAVGHGLACGLPRIVAGPLSPRLAVAVCAALVAVYGWRTWDRSRVWKDDFTLTTTDVEISRNSAQANTAAADFLIVKAQKLEASQRNAHYERAIAHLERALEIHPHYERALVILAEAYREHAGDLEQAIAFYERAYRIHPHRRNLAYVLGTLHLEREPPDPERAVFYLERAVRMDPRHADAARNLGVAYYRRGDPARAVAILEQALRLRPGDPDLERNLAVVREMAASAGPGRAPQATPGSSSSGPAGSGP
jgi:tetratricopeptide (TPR) repeat protein